MGKNYIESSLKRFLKRKVKITLGLVVTFLITGMVSLGAETEIKQENNKNHWEWNQVNEAKKYLQGENQLNSIAKTENTNKNISLEVDNNKINLIIDGQNKIKDLTLKEQDISNKVKINLDSALSLTKNMLKGNFVGSYGEQDTFFDNETSQNVKEVYNEAIKKEAEVGKIEVNEDELTEQNSNNAEIIINKGTIKGNQILRKKGTAYNFGYISGMQTGTGIMHNFGIIHQAEANVAQDIAGSSLGYNYGILIGGYGHRVGIGSIGYNYGIIVAKNQNNPAQWVNEKGVGYNYGYLLGDIGQTVRGKKAYMYNYGLVESKVIGGQFVVENADESFAYNYGTIIGKGDLQLIKAQNSKIYNFGDLKNYSTTDEINSQKIETSKGNSEIYNYGNIINGETSTKDKTGGGQYILGKKLADNIYTENKAYNYGKIEANAGNGQAVKVSGEIYNFGTINVKNDTGYGMAVIGGEKYKAENYGIIDVKNGKAFNGDIVNRGFVITQDGTYTDNAWTGENKGVILKSDLTLGSTDKNQNVIDLSGKTNIVLKDDSISVENKPLENTDGKTTVFMKNQNAQLTGEKYNNKNILAVVDDSSWDSSKAIIQAKDGASLDLTNTVVTGYFAGTKGGTVLSTNSDLTLIGDTVISAIKGEKVTEDVYTLSLEKGENGKSPMLTFVGNAQINGKINGKEGGISNVASHKFETTGGEIGKLQFRNANKEMLNAAGIKAEDNYTDVTVGSGTEELVIDNLELSFRGTAKGKANTVVLGENVKVTGNIDGTNSKHHGEDENITGLGADNKIDLTVNNISNITGNITLGECNDIITVNNNGKYAKVIDGNLGNDTLNVNGNTKKAVSENIFDYKVNSIENINLNGDWRIGKNAEITFKNNSGSSKAVNTNSVNLNVSGKLTAEMNNNKGNGDFTTSLDKITSGNDMTVTAKGGIKYEMGEDFAINSSSFTTNSKFTLGQYEVEKDETTKDIVKEDTKLSASGIFEVSQNKDNSVTLRVKSADELGIGSYAPVYEAILAGVGSKQELTDKLNNIETSEGVAKLVKGTTEAAKAYYTAGNVVTKNIVDTYLSSVTEFKDKADKGEWIAYGKYINSDTEFDGGSEVKGYDGDIKGTVGMIEYGMTDSTSYGAVFGKGDTKVDINDGGELSGDNYYGGLYFKHRTAEGIDVLGSFGIVKSDLDSKLKNSFEVPEIGTADALVDGTADSKAVSAVLKAKKDYYVAEGLKVQPVVGAALTLITQEEAENKKMGLTISQQDVDVYELITGVNLIKEFALESGKLEVGAGVEYSWANSNQDRDAKYMLNGRELTLEDSEIASSRGKAQFGAEYIHENGVGIDAKYEMMWSDSGDDSRITAGISYRF